eukprot:TRINITY_DN5855_c0_g4_i1.p1 TRINITY_DN5855_c0_g4~~TRINITY_DN5855_c0_g4_i1.p1  ORF type:complete len:460 (+),score=128.21 TRINITY_DN5855_c0_g4_i1:464-1843(+)
MNDQTAGENEQHSEHISKNLKGKMDDVRGHLQEFEFRLQKLEDEKLDLDGETIVMKFREVMNVNDVSTKLHTEIEHGYRSLIDSLQESRNLKLESKSLQHQNKLLYRDYFRVLQALNAQANEERHFVENLADNSQMMENILDALRDKPSEDPAPKAARRKEARKVTIPSSKYERLTNALKSYDRPLDAFTHRMELKKSLLHRKYNKQFLVHRLLEKQRDGLKLQEEDILAHNRQLEEALDRSSRSIESAANTIKFYQGFLKKLENLKSHRRNVKSISSTQSIAMAKELADYPIGNEQPRPEEIMQSPTRTIKEMSREEDVDEENEKQVNVSYLEQKMDDGGQGQEMNPHGHFDEGPSRGRKDDSELQFCKLFLLNLARDLYVTARLPVSDMKKWLLQKVDFGGGFKECRSVVRLTRSTSNILDYSWMNREEEAPVKSSRDETLIRADSSSNLVLQEKSF